MNLTPRQFVVASLLIEGPSHGYDIEKRIQSEARRRTVTIGFSSIYQILNRLEAKGYVEHTATVAGGKLKKRYALTPAGKAVLASAFVSALTTVTIKDEGFLLALTNVAQIPETALQALIQERLENIQSGIEALEHYKAELDPRKHILKHLGYERRIVILTSEKEFLERWLKEQKKGA